MGAISRDGDAALVARPLQRLGCHERVRDTGRAGGDAHDHLLAGRNKLYAISIYNNYTDRASWEKLLELIDDLLEEYGKNNYPQMTYKQAVEYCKYWADKIRYKGLDLLTTDYSEVIGISDV